MLARSMSSIRSAEASIAARNRRCSDSARAFDELLDRRLRHAPGFAEAQHAGLRVRAKISAALPALRFAYGADHRSHRRRDALGFGDPLRHRVFEALQLLRALGFGDVFGDAAVASEARFVVEYRLGADADVTQPTLRVGALGVGIGES